jgi:hypothetical protein
MIDANLLLSGTYTAATGVFTGQAITADAASTNTLDLGSARDIGAGDYIKFVFVVTEAFATMVSMNIKIQSSADDSSFVDLLISPLLLTATLIVGAELSYMLPKKQLNDPAGGTPNRYLRAYYDVNTSATAGAILAYIVPEGDEDQRVNYPANYTVASGS